MIAIVTDSTAYITRSAAHALGVLVVPNHYTIGSRQYDEGYCDENSESAPAINGDYTAVKTSQVSAADFMQVFRKLRKEGMEILCIAMSSRLSGTYNSACIAAKQIDPENITVLDSLTTAGGLFMLVKKASQLIKDNVTIDRSVEILNEYKDQIGIVFSVDDMEPLRKSGRLGFVPRSIVTALNIRPILMCRDGTIVSNGTARGRQDQFRKLAGHIPDDAKEVVFHYLDNRLYMDAVINEVKKRFPDITYSIAQLGPVLGVHLGSGVTGISWRSF